MDRASSIIAENPAKVLNSPLAAKVTEPKVLKCVMCSYANACRDKFVEHIVNDHETPENNRKRMSCQLCNFKTRLLREMDEHTALNHREMKTATEIPDYMPACKKQKASNEATAEFTCKSCSFGSTDRMEVVQHFIKAHINISSKKCDDAANPNVEKVKLVASNDKQISKNSILSVKTTFKSSKSIKSKVLHCRRCNFKTSFRNKFAAHLAKKHRQLIQDNDEATDDDVTGIERSEVTNIDDAFKTQVVKNRKCDVDSDGGSSDKENKAPKLQPKKPEASSSGRTISLSDAIFATQTVSSAEDYQGPALERRSSRRLSKKLEKVKQEQLAISSPASKKRTLTKVTKSETLKISCRFCGFKANGFAELANHVKVKHASQKNDAKPVSHIEHQPSSKNHVEKISDEFKCSNCFVFTTSKLYILAQHFGACSGQLEANKESLSHEVKEEGKADQASSSDASSGKVTPFIATNDVGRGDLSQSAKANIQNLDSSTFTSLPKVACDNVEINSSVSPSKDAEQTPSCPSAQPVDPEEDAPKVDGCKISNTTLVDHSHQNEDEVLKKETVAEDASKGTDNSPNNVSTVTNEQQHTDQVSAVGNAQIKPSGSAERPLAFPDARKIFCSKCSFKAESLKILAFHYVKCNGKL